MKKTQKIIGIAILIFCIAFLTLILEGCITNQFEGEQNISTTIIGTKRGNLLVKYKLDDSLIYDEIEINNMALMSDLLKNDNQPVNLRLIIKGCNIQNSTLVYYYGATTLGVSTIYEYEEIYEFVKQHPDLVEWTWKDGVEVSNEKPKLGESPKEEKKPL